MGSFNNTGISGLWIGGKSVRRASLGGKVFFEKHDYDFSLTSDKSILSYADNESATLTATLTDYNEPVSGETVIFTADTPFKTNVINDTGTYDFGDYVTIDLSNFKNIDSLSTGNDGHLKIGSSSTYLNIWGRTFNNYIFCDYYRNGSEIDSVQVSLNHPLIIRDGVLYCKKYIGGQQLIDYTLDVSDVDFTEWEFFGKVIGVDVTVGEYWWASDVTDSNGEATVGYVSKGAGDLNIKVECMNLQETYEVQDCKWYDPMTSASGHWNIPSVVSSSSIFGYSSNGWKFGNASSYSIIKSDVSADYPFSVEYTITDNNPNNNPAPIFIIGDSNYVGITVTFRSRKVIDFIQSGAGATASQHAINYPLPSTLRFELTSSSIKLYVNDVLLTEKGHSLTGTKYLRFDTGSDRMCQIKDFKVKPL